MNRQESLRQTTPYLTPSGVVLDGVELSYEQATTPSVGTLISQSLELDRRRLYDASEAERAIEGHIAASLDFVFSHPFWEAIRDGHPQARQMVLAYVLESRHYLAAAPFRMASGIGPSTTEPDLNLLLAHHVLEEADHDIYFENALAEMGCSRPAIRSAAPLPATSAWISVMRVVASYDPLTAAICSGLLESSAAERSAVSDWHEHLVQSGLLDERVVDAFFEHVRTDLGLGHGNKWRDAVAIAAPISAAQLARALNAVSTVAEAIDRWQSSLFSGVSGDLAELLEALGPAHSGEASTTVVWPAVMLEAVANGAATAEHPASTTNRLVAAAFSMPGLAHLPVDEHRGLAGAQSIAAYGSVINERPSTADDLLDEVKAWMTVLDGHRLWDAMTAEQTNYALTFGWLLENYHYIAAIAEHNGAAIASCTDDAVRRHLTKHLAEELDHGDLLRKALLDNRLGLRIERARPLATTVAFVGGLRLLAQQSWQAYCVALIFLQLSLDTEADGGERHQRFYDAVARRVPQAAALVGAMADHDTEDTSLEHSDDMRALADELVDGGHLSAGVMRTAAAVATSSWSFLDGIRSHYSVGDAAVTQRVGWTVK